MNLRAEWSESEALERSFERRDWEEPLGNITELSSIQSPRGIIAAQVAL